MPEWCGWVAVLISQPLTTETWSMSADSGLKASDGDHGPLPVGVQRSRRTPLPQNHRPKRSGRLPPSAQASPWGLSMASRAGSATVAAAPPKKPRSTVRRSRVNRPCGRVLLGARAPSTWSGTGAPKRGPGL